MICESCGTALPDETNLCPNCGAILTKSPNHVDETDMFDMSNESLDKVPKESRNKSTAIVGVVAILVVAVLVIAIVMKIVNKDGASSKLVHGAVKSVTSSGAEFKITAKEDGDKVTVKGFYTIDHEDNELVFYVSLVDEDDDKTELAYKLDEKSYYAYRSYYDYWYEEDVERCYKYKIPSKVDTELVFKLLGELSKKNIEKIDWEYYLDEFDLIDEIEDYIEPKDINKAMAAVLKALDKNAKDCLGYKKDGDTYSYKIDVYDTLMVALDAVEKYAADEDDFEDLKDAVKDSKRYIKKIGDIEFKVVYDGKYISEIEFEFGDIEIELTLENVGECDETLSKKIEKAMSEAGGNESEG